MDVVALYPSIDQEQSAALIRDTFLDSDIKVTNVDVKAASLYLALTVPHEELVQEGFQNLVPRRKTNRGRKPTIRTHLMAGPLPRERRGCRKNKEEQTQPTGQETTGTQTRRPNRSRPQDQGKPRPTKNWSEN